MHRPAKPHLPLRWSPLSLAAIPCLGCLERTTPRTDFYLQRDQAENMNKSRLRMRRRSGFNSCAVELQNLHGNITIEAKDITPKPTCWADIGNAAVHIATNIASDRRVSGGGIARRAIFEIWDCWRRNVFNGQLTNCRCRMALTRTKTIYQSLLLVQRHRQAPRLLLQ